MVESYFPELCEVVFLLNNIEFHVLLFAYISDDGSVVY